MGGADLVINFMQVHSRVGGADLGGGAVLHLEECCPWLITVQVNHVKVGGAAVACTGLYNFFMMTYKYRTNTMSCLHTYTLDAVVKKTQCHVQNTGSKWNRSVMFTHVHT